MIDKFQGETRWLSNFAPAPIEFEGILYPTTENAYQAAKTVNLKERHYFETCTPGDAKRQSRKLELRSDWEDIKVEIMLTLNRQKYKIPYYKDKLLRTGTQDLIEGNTWGDTFWGVCNGVGENNLGRILMQIREELN